MFVSYLLVILESVGIKQADFVVRGSAMQGFSAPPRWVHEEFDLAGRVSNFQVLAGHCLYVLFNSMPVKPAKVFMTTHFIYMIFIHISGSRTTYRTLISSLGYKALLIGIKLQDQGSKLKSCSM